MTTVTLENFRGISASFELGRPLSLLCGRNGAGKTRIAKALGAVLASEPLPLTGKRGDLREVPGKDADKATVRLDGGDAIRSIVWPAGETSVKGDQAALPHATVWAAGLRHPLDLSGKERAQAFADIFKTEPSQKNLADAFDKRGLSRHFKAVWSTVEISGWDAAALAAEMEAKTLKGRWNEVTGGTWGERVGETWAPDEAKFPDEEELNAHLEIAEENLADAKAALESSRKVRAELDEPQEAQKVYECAHCGKPNVIHFGKLAKAEQVKPISSQERTDARMAIAEADGKIAHAQDQVYHHNREVGAAKARLQDVAKVKSTAQTRAAELHEQIMEQLKIAQVCGPSGLRKAKLEHVLGKVNESLATIASEIGLPAVHVEPDLDLRRASDGELYRRLSRGEQFLARVLLQIEIARRDGSTMVVVDDLDVPIDPNHRNAVLQALHGCGMLAVVMLAARAPQQRFAPDLSMAGQGWELCRTYWVESVPEEVVDPDTGEVRDRAKETRVRPIDQTAAQKAA